LLSGLHLRLPFQHRHRAAALPAPFFKGPARRGITYPCDFPPLRVYGAKIPEIF
jgi:hypothetical protein